MLQCGSIQITYNICRIKSYKSDTKVEYFNPKNMEIKAWNKLYDRMHTATFDVNSYCLCT